MLWSVSRFRWVGRSSNAAKEKLFVSKPLLGWCTLFLLLSVAPYLAHAEVVLESESLRGFLAGNAPNAAYDNWLSHVTEGVVTEGYNDYGPTWLDPQTNGFGSYRQITDTPAGDRNLEHWRRIFNSLLVANEVNVDALLSDSLETFHYELVRFTDTDRDRDVLIIREQLDSSFVDVNNQGSLDDVIGGFRNGWGVYLVDQDAPRPWLMIQMVHPCDDFIGVQAAIDLFFRLGAGALCINGAGREALVSPGAGSLNSRSLSDPSRNGRAPLQTFQEAFVDRYADQYPYSAMVVQLHSYDRSNNLHHPVIISEGADWPYPNLPFCDRSGGYNTIIQSTANPPIESGQYIGLGPLAMDGYYGINHVNGYNFSLPDGGDYLIARPISHRGDPNNVQGLHIHGVPSYVNGQAIAPFVHIEFDEWPEFLDDGGLEPEQLVDDPPGVPTWEDYQPWLAFYEPFFVAFAAWLEWFDDPVDDLPASQPEITSANVEADGTVVIRIEDETPDYNRAWVEVLADTALVQEDSPVVLDGRDTAALKKTQLNTMFTLYGLPEGRPVYIAVRSVKLNGATGPISTNYMLTPLDNTGITPEHTHFESYPHHAWPPWIAAEIEDDWDLYDIRVMVQLNDSEIDTFTLERYPSASLIYANPIPIDSLDVTPGDLVRYAIVTRDMSISGNPVYLPSESEAFEFTVSDEVSLLRSWDFELDADSIELRGDWEWGIPTTTPPGSAHSGQKVVGTNLEGAYTTNLFNHMTLPGIMRMEFGPLIVSFWQRVDYPIPEGEPGVALQGGLLYWTDGFEQGPIRHPAYTHRIRSESGSFNGYDVFSGTNESWQRIVMDLGQYYGRGEDLHFYSPPVYASGSHMGWYIDDLQVSRSINTQPPQRPILVSPAPDHTVNEEIQTFVWRSSIDPDPRTQPFYNFHLEGMTGSHVVEGLSDTTFSLNIWELGWAGAEPQYLAWSVLSTSQGDTVSNTGGPRLLVLPAAAVDENDGLPGTFQLGQAYPNPFNASLSIRFELPERTHVQLEIFNLLGQRVARIEDRVMDAGYRRAVWDARGHASGLYLIRMEAADFRATRKVLLIK